MSIRHLRQTPEFRPASPRSFRRLPARRDGGITELYDEVQRVSLEYIAFAAFLRRNVHMIDHENAENYRSSKCKLAQAGHAEHAGLPAQGQRAGAGDNKRVSPSGLVTQRQAPGSMRSTPYYIAYLKNPRWYLFPGGSRWGRDRLCCCSRGRGGYQVGGLRDGRPDRATATGRHLASSSMRTPTWALGRQASFCSKRGSGRAPGAAVHQGEMGTSSPPPPTTIRAFCASGRNHQTDVAAAFAQGKRHPARRVEVTANILHRLAP